MKILGITIRWPLMLVSTHEQVMDACDAVIDELEAKLRQAQKNDMPRDTSGRFISKKHFNGK